MFKFAAKKVLVSHEESEVLDMDRLSSGSDEEEAADDFQAPEAANDDFPAGLVDGELHAELEINSMNAMPMSEMMSAPPPRGGWMAPPPPPAPATLSSRLLGLFSPSSGAAPPPSSPVSRSRAPAPPKVRAPRPPPKTTGEYRAADTNVFALALGSLASDAHLLSGELVKCANCSAAFSHISKLEEASDSAASSSSQSAGRVWTCEFCDHTQAVDMDDEERPQESTNDYLVEPPQPGSSSEQLVVFVLDISGSMCVTTEVQGQVQLKGVQSLARMRAELGEELSQQWMPGQRQDVTYLSRLQAAQGAISQQVQTLKREHPNARVALITFSSEVTLLGDGSQEPVVVAGDRLSDFDALFALGQDQAVATPVSDSADKIESLLWELQEGGATALGPAALIAVGMAAKASSSKIILCTDGLANVGVGSLDGMNSAAERQELREWYLKLGNIARESGTTMSVVSIAGSGCCMEYLGLLADATAGDVDIVEAQTLLTNFASLMSTPAIATNVQATLLLNKALFIRTDQAEVSSAVRDVGNVYADSEVTFEFGVRREYLAALRAARPSTEPSTEATSVPKQSPAPIPILPTSTTSAAPPPVAKPPAEVPFQVQVTFRKMDGSKMTRVVTALQAISFDRSEVEQDVDVDVIGRNVLQRCADYAHAGEYEKAQLHNITNQRLMRRAAKDKSSVTHYAEAGAMLHQTIQSELMREQQSSPAGYPQPAYSASAAPVSQSVKQSREARRLESDATSNMMYQMKSTRSKK